MLTSANGQPAKATRTADEFNVPMPEVVALGAILLNVFSSKRRGTADRRGDAAAHRPADSDKLREARERLEQASGSKAS